MDFQAVAPYLFFALGVTGRVVIPYVLERLKANGPLSFDWRYAVGQLIAAVIALIPLIAGEEFLAHVGSLSWAAALLYGWGASDIGRKAQKALGR